MLKISYGYFFSVITLFIVTCSLLPVTGPAKKPSVCRPKLIVRPTSMQPCDVYDAYIKVVTDVGVPSVL